MARIRTIKPEFPQSESIGKLSRDARLLYIQLWTLVDDEGRTRASSRMLASLLYPYDDDARLLIDGWLDELERGSHLRRYEVDGSQYLEICKWLEHQKIDRPSKSRLPAFAAGSVNPREESRNLDADLGPSTVDLVPSPPVAKATRGVDEKFDEFWRERPRRAGDDPRKPAEKKFKALVKTGVDPDLIISGAKLATAAAKEQGRYGTQYVPQTVKWLNDQRFVDYAAAAFTENDEPEINWDDQVARFKRGFQWSAKWCGPEPGMAGCRVPADILAKHGYTNEGQELPTTRLSQMQPPHTTGH